MAKHRLKAFSKTALLEAASKGEQWGFNGRLPLPLVDSLPDGEYPAVIVMAHHHRQGQPCEAHCRCGVILNERLTTFDVPQWFFEALPEGDFEIDN
jgi:hypothetical protein